MTTWYLIIIIAFSSVTPVREYHQMPDLETCLKVVEETRIQMPHTDNGHEGVALVTCGTKK